jgi:hypothetical protein
MANKLRQGLLTGGYGTVILMWFFFTSLWYLYLGFHFDLEAEKYIHEAAYLLQYHRLSETRYLFYFSTTAIIAFCDVVGLGLHGALLLIMAVNLFSYLFFFRALVGLFKDRLLALLVVFLLLSFWPYQSWTLYLYTECFFYSAVLMLFAQLLLCRSLSLRFLVLTSLLLFLVVSSRPLGILFVFPTLLFIFFKLSGRQKLLFALAVLLAFVLFNYIVQTVFTTTSDWSLKKTIAEADIICNIPGPASGEKLDLSDNPNQLYQLFYYVTHNFFYFSSLALARLRYFFTMVRSYYSSFHNAVLVAYLLLIYISILFGIKSIVRFLSPALCLFIFSTLVFFTVTIALQCDDYHNRFFLTLMPFLMTMTVVALRPLIYRFPFLKNRNTSKGESS